MARQKEFDPDEALQAAVGVFRRQGYTATSVQNLVDAMGIGRGSMYATFGDKHALFLRALEHYATSAGAQTPPLEGADPMLAVRDFIRSAVFARADPAKRCGCLISNSANELSLLDETVASAVGTVLVRNENRFHELLVAAQAFGSFPFDRNARAAARFVMCAMQGLNVMVKAHPDPAAIDDMVDEILRNLG